MTVSLLQILMEIPDCPSLKDKRRVVKSIKDKLIHRYKVSAAEVDLQDSHSFAQIGAALVSNSKDFGEKILNKAFAFVEDNYPVRVVDYKIITEFYG
ncbi:MAG: DUF503 domain-containing protein [Spirochaetales bacterium]|nr:DUF503 domain-containing protein [Spirochaetales bacterium]